VDLSDATVSSLTRLLRDELVQLCEARNLEVGGTKPQLARALIEWVSPTLSLADEKRDEQAEAENDTDGDEDVHETTSTNSSQATARPTSVSAPNTTVPTKKKQQANGNGNGNGHGKKGDKVIHAVASHVHVNGKTTPVLLRDHTHAEDPATPPHSEGDQANKGGAEGGLDLDLSGLGLEDSMIKPHLLVKLEKIGSGGFKE
jgi:hypothetical protein